MFLHRYHRDDLKRLDWPTGHEDNHKTTARQPACEQFVCNTPAGMQRLGWANGTRRQPRDNQTTTRPPRDNHKTTTKQPRDNHETTTRQPRDNYETTDAPTSCLQHSSGNEAKKAWLAHGIVIQHNRGDEVKKTWQANGTPRQPRDNHETTRRQPARA